MAVDCIDVWDARTFDPDLIAPLDAEADLIGAYFERERHIFFSYDIAPGLNRPELRPGNPHASAFYDLRDSIMRQMETRTIRAYHYTRLTDDEVADLLRDGIHVSTPETLRRRLDAIVASGHLSPDAADRLYAESPFHSNQLDSRSGKFWLTSDPITVDDAGVAPLMEHWGGEVASMWVRDLALSAPLLTLGQSRIIEAAVPLRATNHSYAAGKAVVATFARSRGAIPGKCAFDLCIQEALPATALLAVHTKGDAAFKSMGRDYPEGFVKTDEDWWKGSAGAEA